MTHGERLAVLVLGMHRSGAGALADALAALGAAAAAPGIARIHDELLEHLGTAWDDPRPVRRGGADVRFFRDRLVETLSGEGAAAPVVVVRDPRVCRLVSLWQEVLAEVDREPRFALVARSPTEVAASLARRPGLPEPAARLLWLDHCLAVERDTRDARRCFTTYARLLADPREAVRIAGALGVASDADPDALETVEGVVDPALRHWVADASDPEPPWLAATLAAWERAADGDVDEAAFDDLRERAEAAAELHLPWAAHLATARGEPEDPGPLAIRP